MSDHCEGCIVPASLTYELRGTARTKNSNIILPKTCSLSITDEKGQVKGRYYFTVETTSETQDLTNNIHIPKQMVLNLYEDTIPTNTPVKQWKKEPSIIPEVVCPK